METYDGPAWRLIRVSPVHPYNAEDSDGGGWGSGSEGMCTRHARVMLCIVFVTMLPDMVDDSFTSTICLYWNLSLS